jgi:hypothetical protein
MYITLKPAENPVLSPMLGLTLDNCSNGLYPLPNKAIVNAEFLEGLKTLYTALGGQLDFDKVST